jgi:hypothetical protein
MLETQLKDYNIIRYITIERITCLFWLACRTQVIVNDFVISNPTNMLSLIFYNYRSARCCKPSPSCNIGQMYRKCQKFGTRQQIGSQHPGSPSSRRPHPETGPIRARHLGNEADDDIRDPQL